MDIGFVGVGKMGRPMVERLLAAGHTVTVFSRSTAAIEAVAASGALPASSPAELVDRSTVIETALPTPESVDEVYSAFEVVARADQVFIDHSTIRPDQNRNWAERLSSRSAHYLDAPVSGGPGGAATGSLTVMVGGSEQILERVRPVLEAFGATIRHCGPVGAGQVVKLVNQLLVGIHTAAIAEAAVFGARLGADPEILLDLVGRSYGGSTMMVRHLPRFMDRDFEPATPVNLILKDLGLIHDEAIAFNVPLLLGALAEQRFVEARACGLGERDMAALVQLWEAPAGVTVTRSQGNPGS
jgi:3-hydroxyisobutyrate dehydrogenase-like beta-hydroxyacid dehydrogenase